MGMIEELNSRSEEALLGLIGLEIVDAEDYISSRLELREELLAPNGYLHAATIVALADASCGYGTFVYRPEGGFRLHHDRAEEGPRVEHPDRIVRQPR